MSKIVYTDGCVVSGLTVDDRIFSDLSLEEQKEIIHKIVDNVSDSSYLQDMLIEYTQSAGEYEYLYTCEQCGDSVCEWALEI